MNWSKVCTNVWVSVVSGSFEYANASAIEELAEYLCNHYWCSWILQIITISKVFSVELWK